jgi:hypothetical protein
MTRMAEDLASDIENLQFGLERAQAGVTAGRRLADPVQRATLHSDSLARSLTALQFCSIFIENPAEYAALRNSGRLGVITDAELRRRIVASYEKRVFLHMLFSDDCSMTEIVSRSMAPYVRLVEPPEVRGVYERSSDGLPDSSRPRVVAITNGQQLFQSTEFISAITTLVSRRRFLASQIQATILDAEQLQGELRERVSRASD